ncbi:MAG: replicative DNA helicase [bacterium]
MKDITPPQNLDAEKSLLGAMLLDKTVVEKTIDIVRGEDFYDEQHGAIFEAIRDLYNEHRPIDVVTVADALEGKGVLEKIGGASKLAALTTSPVSSAHAVQYAEIVANKATLRRLISAANTIGGLALADNIKMEEVLDKCEQTLFNVSRKHLRSSFVPVKEFLSGAFERIDSLHENRGSLRGISTGFKDLDNKLAGLQNSDLIIIAARPSMGKTSLALNMALNAAQVGHFAVGIFSLEMSKEQLLNRLLSAVSGIDAWKLQTGNLAEGDFAALSEAMGVLAEVPIYVDDAAFVNVMEIRTKARRLKSEKGLDLLVIDHIQLMDGAINRESRVQEMSEISRSLKALAKELNIPVLAVSQLSRAVEQRLRKIPQLSDLRESGSIEQDADVVMFVYRDEYYNPQSERKNIADIIIAKHRNGPVGQIELFFDANRMMFRSLERHRLEGKPVEVG